MNQLPVDAEVRPDRSALPTGRVPTWHARSGRLTARKRWALDELALRYAPRFDGLDPGRFRSWAVEIGAGTGEAALALAEAHPERLVTAAEVHKASLARLLLSIDERRPDNLWVVAGDGRSLLQTAVTDPPLTLVRVFFPDPWPKTRHAARRLLDAALVADIAERLAVGGRFEFATDDAAYARRTQLLVAAEPRLADRGDARAERPRTYYEQRALDSGRAVHDRSFERVAPGEDQP